MITLKENPEYGNALNTADAELVTSYRQLMGGRILEGFALLRIADMPNDET